MSAALSDGGAGVSAGPCTAASWVLDGRLPADGEISNLMLSGWSAVRRIVIPGLSAFSGVVRLVTIASPETMTWPFLNSSLMWTRVPTARGSLAGTKIPLVAYFAANFSLNSCSSAHGIFRRYAGTGAGFAMGRRLLGHGLGVRLTRIDSVPERSATSARQVT